MGKDHPRVQAYGAVDEAMSAIGMAAAALPESRAFAPLRGTLARAQRELFDAGALLASPPGRAARLGRHAGPPPEAVARLEAEIDGWAADLKPLKHFILPGGAVPAAALHLARAVCRRAEREVVALSRREKVPGAVIVYLNRLSDHLYTAARWVNWKLQAPETSWEGLAESRR